VTTPPLERYRLYIDESGDHVFEDEATLAREDRRYLALVGCWFAGGAYRDFHRELQSLKGHHFPHHPDEPVILHRRDIVERRGCFWRLDDQRARERFDADLLALIEQAEFTLVAAVVDKLALKRGGLEALHPYHMALAFLLQRYCGYLNYANRQGDVMVESRGGHEDRLLRRAYGDIYDSGDRFHASEFFQRCLTSRQLKLNKKSGNISGLQLVDLLANPVRRDVLLKRNASKHPPSRFEVELFSVLARKYNRDLYSGKVEGHGWLVLPT